MTLSSRAKRREWTSDTVEGKLKRTVMSMAAWWKGTAWCGDGKGESTLRLRLRNEDRGGSKVEKFT